MGTNPLQATALVYRDDTGPTVLNNPFLAGYTCSHRPLRGK